MDAIRHCGIVSGRNSDTLFVTIVSQSACSACHAKGMCQAGELKEKVVEVRHFTGDYAIGQEVTLFLQETAGLKAVLFGYVFPFIVVMASLIIFLKVTGDEIIAGLISIAMLIPYYVGLYFSRDRMKRTFHFSVEENNQNSL